MSLNWPPAPSRRSVPGPPRAERVDSAAGLPCLPGQIGSLIAEGRESGNTLARREVNLELAGFTAGDHGFVSFIASDEEAVRSALTEASISFTEHPALLVKTPDRPGEAAKIGRLLEEAEVNIDAYLPTSICGGEVTVAISVDKIDDARRALGELVVG